MPLAGKDKFIVPPVDVKVGDGVAEILEVLPIRFPDGKTVYHVVCRLKWRGITTRTFFVDARDEAELLRKLDLELSKLKTIYLARGRRFTEEVVKGWART